jgi:hypothetical protein
MGDTSFRGAPIIDVFFYSLRRGCKITCSVSCYRILRRGPTPARVIRASALARCWKRANRSHHQRREAEGDELLSPPHRRTLGHRLSPTRLPAARGAIVRFPLVSPDSTAVCRVSDLSANRLWKCLRQMAMLSSLLFFYYHDIFLRQVQTSNAKQSWKPGMFRNYAI